MQLGFVGMGIMGLPMSQHLLQAGHAVSVYNRTQARTVAAAAAGATISASLAALAQHCDIVFICVSDTPDVEAVLFGPGGLSEGLGPGKIVVDHSTISPEATEEFAARVRAQGADYLDAPVSGGQSGAVNGTLTIMVGGGEQTFERVRPYLETMGTNIVHCGRQGNGQRVKAVNQVICALNIVACSEGMLFAKAQGLDLETVHRVVSNGAAGSWMLSNLAPRMIAGQFEPGFAIRLQAKDLNIATATMASLDGQFEGTALAARLFNAAVGAGFGEQGTQGLVNLLGWGE